MKMFIFELLLVAGSIAGSNGLSEEDIILNELAWAERAVHYMRIGFQESDAQPLPPLSTYYGPSSLPSANLEDSTEAPADEVGRSSLKEDEKTEANSTASPAIAPLSLSRFYENPRPPPPFPLLLWVHESSEARPLHLK